MIEIEITNKIFNSCLLSKMNNPSKAILSHLIREMIVDMKINQTTTHILQPLKLIQLAKTLVLITYAKVMNRKMIQQLD